MKLNYDVSLKYTYVQGVRYVFRHIKLSHNLIT
jgi:hypothetical protein